MYTIFDSRFTKSLPHVHKLREAVSHARANEKPAAGSLLTSGWFIVWTHTANAATSNRSEADVRCRHGELPLRRYGERRDSKPVGMANCHCAGTANAATACLSAWRTAIAQIRRTPRHQACRHGELTLRRYGERRDSKPVGMANCRYISSKYRFTLCSSSISLTVSSRPSAS